MSEKHTVLDLFSGAGGLTEGFSSIDMFRFIAHVEMDPNAARTLETRLGYHLLRGTGSEDIYQKYLKNEITRDEYITRVREMSPFNDNLFVTRISNDSIEDLFLRIDQARKNTGSGADRIDVVIGGPPCQAYSCMGRARDPGRMVNDPRNYLYLHYIAFLIRYQPSLFVFENVPGIRSAKNGHIFKDLVRRVIQLGYSIDRQVLNAADFGVLQERKREIIIGWKEELDFQYPNFPKIRSGATVQDLLSDLPALHPGEGTDLPQDYCSAPSEYLRTSEIRTAKDDDIDVLRNHWARGHNERDREIYRLAIRELGAGKRLRYDHLPPELRTHKNVTSFLDRFKVVDPARLSHAVVAHISKDGHYYIHPDINQARSLTVREVARIQSFPDSYLFEGARREQFKQVGNAVPPMMAQGIANQIHAMLKRI